MNRQEIIVKALWDWLHAKHPSEDGEHKVRNASLWGVVDESCIGIDAQVDLRALAKFIDERLGG